MQFLLNQSGMRLETSAPHAVLTLVCKKGHNSKNTDTFKIVSVMGYIKVFA
jgi:hypothetical protein